MAYLVLMGPMMAGKTKLGKRIAKLSSREFIDTDKVITARHGNISDIFVEKGEPYMREVEQEAVSWALAHDDAIVSLGGGAVLAEANQQLLRKEQVVLLTLTVQAAQHRLALSHERPLLKHGGIDAWAEITERRMPLYRSLASAEFDTSSGTMESIATQIYEWRESL
ncbi:MAG: shikimate kinase [Microbacteriaceae bacterium]